MNTKAALLVIDVQNIYLAIRPPELTCDGDDLLEVGETWVYTASYTVQASDPDPLINTAVVTGM